MHPSDTQRIPNRLSPLITYKQKMIVPIGVEEKIKLRWIIATWPTVAMDEIKHETKAIVNNATYRFNDVNDPNFMRTLKVLDKLMSNPSVLKSFLNMQ